jgi:alkanesulfonate monooxygenase SsuD/methylene tetrahydromethanopterin reductase-like flavin-dependent oxidoreductase (luciferase family)
MKFGIALETFTPPGKSPSKDSILKMAKTAEKFGFDSVWVWDHLLLGSRKVFPVLDSTTTLSYLSSATSRVKLGTSVLIMALRNPLVLAKTLSAIQIFSDGRVVLGAAAGWYEREFVATGVDFAKRGRLFEDEFQLVRRLLNESDVNYVDDTIKLEHATILPKSSSPIPMLMGGYSKTVLERTGKFADGWISYYYTSEDFVDSWNIVRASAVNAGKDPSLLRSVDLVPLAISDSLEQGDKIAKEFTSNYMDLPKNAKCTPESAVKGTLKECVSQIKRFELAGLDELVFIPANYDLDFVEKAGNEILPAFKHS